jgi:hypothetical protein
MQLLLMIFLPLLILFVFDNSLTYIDQNLMREPDRPKDEDDY